MARTIQEIYEQIVNRYVSEAAAVDVQIQDPATWRLVSRRRLWAYAQAYCIWVLETLFDIHYSRTNEALDAKEPGTPRWYVKIAKEFQYGYQLVNERDYYDNTGIDPELIKQSKIVAFAAFVEKPFVRLKVARLQGANLAKLTDDQLTAFHAYMGRRKYAGVKLKPETITSTDPDQLLLRIRVVVDPLVIRQNGMAILDSSFPVPAAVRRYLQNIDFNGVFSVQKLEAEVLAVPGVIELKIDQIQTKYGLLPFRNFDMTFIPDSGYLVIEDSNLNIAYANPE